MCLVHRRLLLHGVQPDLQKFSKVSALVHVTYKGTIKRGFENVCVHWVQPDLKRAWDQCRKSSTTTSPATRQKSPANTAKETYNAAKEPCNVTKEPYYRGKRALRPRQKRPAWTAPFPAVARRGTGGARHPARHARARGTRRRLAHILKSQRPISLCIAIDRMYRMCSLTIECVLLL